VDQFSAVHSVMEAKRNVGCPVFRREVRESELPLELLYNTKIERIRALEMKNNKQPEAIKFTLQESLKPGFKKAKFDCPSFPTPQLLEINIANPPKFIQGSTEKYNRNNIGKQTVDDIQLADYTSKYP
jgi:hypothetical protein